MTRSSLALLLAVGLALPATAADFAALFADATLRVDYFHSGAATSETVTLDRLYRQGAWAGPRTELVDPFGYGAFTASLVADDGTVLYSLSYDSYFNEYRSTEAAIAGSARTYHETVLLPFPRQPATVVIERVAGHTRLAAFRVDPASDAISTEPPRRDVVIVEEHVPAPPERAFDLVILGEGYTRTEEALFRTDLARFAAVLLGQQPFAERAGAVAVRGVLAPSAESGCDEPTHGRYRDTALGTSFNALGSYRYLLTEDNRAVRDVAAAVPYDALAIMVNHHRYGGGGIYQQLATFTAHNHFSAYVFVHELGHSIAGLADEYYTSDSSSVDFYPPGQEPASPNITALLDPSALKWADLVSPGAALPTVWNKAAYDTFDLAYQKRRGELNAAIAAAVRARRPAAEIAALEQAEEAAAIATTEGGRALLAVGVAPGAVAAFEGGGYAATGIYRPAADCLMFSKALQPFCPVCARAVGRTLDRSVN